MRGNKPGFCEALIKHRREELGVGTTKIDKGIMQHRKHFIDPEASGLKRIDETLFAADALS
jgi:hypothetical protein